MYDENSNASVVTASAVAASALPSAAASISSASVSGGAAPSTAIVSQLLNVKDSRWLQVEVCREFQRGQCARSDQECKFAHPPPHVDVQQGRVTACYDSIKGRCTRENPKCKYLHPPQHIKDQLLINGRNNLALKNLISAQLNQSAGQPLVNPMQSLQQMQIHQQQASLAAAAANMMPTLPYPYYQGMMYPAAMLQAADPYQAAVNQQLQAVALLQQQQQQQQQQAAQAQSQAGVGMDPRLAAAIQAQLAAVSAAAASAPGALSLPGAQAAAVLHHQQQQQHQQTSRKRALEEDDSSAQQQQMFNLAAAVSAAAGVPCKRPAMDKNGAVVYQAAAAAGPGQQFNPYLLQGLQGYMPAVSFSGQVPPRY